MSQLSSNTQHTHQNPSAPSAGRETMARRGRGVAVVVTIIAAIAFVLLAVHVAQNRTVPSALDVRVGHWALTHRHPGLTVLAQTLTFFGSVPGIIGAAVLCAAWLWRIRHRGFLAVAFLVTEAVTAGLVTLIKVIIARPRPNPADLIGMPAMDYAFPSGHTTNSAVVYVLFAVLVGLTLRRGRYFVVIPMIILALFIGASRVYLGYHYATDVLGGWLLATGFIAAAMVVVLGRPTATAPQQTS